MSLEVAELSKGHVRIRSGWNYKICHPYNENVMSPIQRKEDWQNTTTNWKIYNSKKKFLKYLLRETFKTNMVL